MERVADIFLQLMQTREKWQHFLESVGIHNFSTNEIAAIDETIAIFNDKEEMVATGTVAGNIIKYVAVSSQVGKGKNYFNMIMSELENRLLIKGISHYFVYTKPDYEKSFGFVGFTTLAKTPVCVLLEKGNPTINCFLDQFPKGDPTKKNAAIVMNANPFTLGHQYLVEKAASENDWVYIFVVSEDQSLFTTVERLALVKAGVSHLGNVSIMTTSVYMVSYTTFPAYFIKDSADVVTYQTQIDANLFKKWFVPYFSITSRYLGEEPLSSITERYNMMLKEVLEPEVAVIITPRKKRLASVISATCVREYLAENRLEALREIVPDTTFDYIISHAAAINKRKEG